jgi:hypothetical protein
MSDGSTDENVRSPLAPALAGLLLIAIGVGVGVLALDYGFGTPDDLGPGVFPALLSVLALLLGVLALAGAFLTPEPPLERGSLWPLLLITASMVLFPIALPAVGLFLTGFATAALALLAAPPPIQWGRLVITSLGLSLLITAIFAWGLGLPVKVWP